MANFIDSNAELIFCSSCLWWKIKIWRVMWPHDTTRLCGRFNKLRGQSNNPLYICNGLSTTLNIWFNMALKSTSRTSEGPWPRNCEGPWFSTDQLLVDMIYQKLHHAYVLEMAMAHIPIDHEIWYVACHVGVHVDFSSTIISLDPHAFTF